MIKKILLTLIIVVNIFIGSCADETTSATGDCVRIGAICNDGTRSSATGSGACSHHGGVKEWICK